MANTGERQKHRSPVNIIAVDIGTTTISCHHFDQSGISVYQTSRKVRKIKAYSKLDLAFRNRRKHDLFFSTFISFKKTQMKNFQPDEEFSCSSDPNSCANYEGLTFDYLATSSLLIGSRKSVKKLAQIEPYSYDV